MERAYTIEQLKAQLIPVFRKNHVRQATLFGSYGKGTATARSDIDLLVDSGLRGISFFGLLEDVCQSVACPVDLIDVADVVPGSPIEEEIARTGRRIYSQEKPAPSSKTYTTAMHQRTAGAFFIAAAAPHPP